MIIHTTTVKNSHISRSLHLKDAVPPNDGYYTKKTCIFIVYFQLLKMYFSSFVNCTSASHKNTDSTKDKEYGVSRGIDFQGG